jgi:DNA-binding MarR family transcriptional regulator
VRADDGPATPPRWLDDEQQRAWRKLAAMMTLLPAALDTQLQRDSDLPHFAYYVLAMLSEAPGRALRMSVLAARSSSSPSRLSHTVSRLESRGLVHRRRADDDGRGQVAELTREGYACLAAAAPGHVQEVRRLVFDGLAPAQVSELDRVCTRLLATLDPDGSLASYLPEETGGDQGPDRAQDQG